MNKHLLFRVGASNKAETFGHIKPLHRSSNTRNCNQVSIRNHDRVFFTCSCHFSLQKECAIVNRSCIVIKTKIKSTKWPNWRPNTLKLMATVALLLLPGAAFSRHLRIAALSVLFFFVIFALLCGGDCATCFSCLLCGSFLYSFGKHDSRRLCISISDLEKDEYVIGRKATADIVIPEPAISNVHCTITRVWEPRATLRANPHFRNRHPMQAT